MSATARRLLAIPIGMLGFGLQLSAKVWLWPLARGWDVRVGLPAFLTGLTLCVMVPFGIFALIGGYRRRPATFAVGKGFLVAAPAVTMSGNQTMLSFVSGGLAIPPELAPGAHSAAMATDAFTSVTVALVGVFCASGVCYAVLRRPSVQLDPRGLTVRRLSGRTFIGWDDVDPPGPPPPDALAPRTLRVFQRDGSRVVRVPLGRLEVTASFLTEAIRHYAQHPDARAAIGTTTELARLGAELAHHQTDGVRPGGPAHGATNAPVGS